MEEIQWIPTDDDCEQEMIISDSPTPFYTEPEGHTKNITIYAIDEMEIKYYLKVDVLTYAVTLDCEDAYHNVKIYVYLFLRKCIYMKNYYF